MYKPPPGDLNNRNPLMFVAQQSEPLWYRGHDTNLGAIFFGKTASYRWDAPKGEYGVLYLGGDPFCAFMESIGRGVLGTRFVPQAVLKQRDFSKVALKRPLRLIDMVNAGGLARLGTEASLTSGSGYRNSQRWSKALREHPRSRMASTTVRGMSLGWLHVRSMITVNRLSKR